MSAKNGNEIRPIKNSELSRASRLLNEFLMLQQGAKTSERSFFAPRMLCGMSWSDGETCGNGVSMVCRWENGFESFEQFQAFNAIGKLVWRPKALQYNKKLLGKLEASV